MTTLIPQTRVRRISRATGLDRVFEPSDPADRSQLPVLMFIWFVWTVVMIVLIAAHEPWRDELQAWAIARSSGNPFELIANLRYEGHPPLWYLLLWPVTKVLPGIVGLKFVTILVGSAATWVALRFMPVSIWLRVAILFGYFPLYEYGVISRSYTAAWLCLVVALWLAHRAQTSAWVIAIALGALASTTALAVPLAFAIALALWGGRRWASPIRGPGDRRYVWAFGAALLAVVAYGVFKSRTSLGSTWSAFSAPLVAAAPVSPLTDRFWGNLLVLQLAGAGAVIGSAVTVIVARSLRKSISARTIWIASTLGFTIVMAESGRGMAPRFAGIVWMGAIAAVWFASAERRCLPAAERQPIHIATKAACVLVLAASLWAAGWAGSIDATTPFTGAKAAGDWITERADGPIVILCASTVATCSSVSIRLDVPAYSFADSDPFSFMVFKPKWKKHIDVVDILESAARIEARTGAQVFIVDAPVWFLSLCAQSMTPVRAAGFETVSVCLPRQPVP